MSMRIFSTRLTLRQRLMFLGGSGLALVVVLTGSNVLTDRLKSAIEERRYTVAAMAQHQLEADMMHDALRADSYQALLSASEPGIDAEAAKSAQAEIEEAVQEHAERITEQFDENQRLVRKLDLPAIAAAVAQAQGKLDGYAEAAQAIVAAAFSDLESARHMRGEFQSVFEQLEGDMSDLSELIGEEVAAADIELADVESRALWIEITVCTLAALFSLFMIVSALRAVARPLGVMTTAMRKIADGDLTAEIPALGRTDEIGSMAKAVQVFKDNAIEKQRLEAAAKAEAEHQREAAEAQRKLEEAAGAEVARVVSAAAAGDLTKRIDNAGKTGFFQKLGEGMNGLLDAVNSAVGEVASVMSAMAQGDLSKRIEGDHQGEFLKLKTDTNATAEKLAQIVGQTVEGMANIKASTTEIASGAQDLSLRTEEQVASLEEIAASIRQLNSTVQQSAENAGQASQLAVAARSSAEGGGEIAGAAVKAMGEIEQSSQKISDIVGMIDEIAFQTNLLALNAAVEAARAGEAGRGFAVVAGEVRALAQRSSHASKEIKTLISNSNTQVKQGVELVNKAGGTLGEIVTAVKRVSDIVAEIAAANKEQSASVGEVQEAIGQIEQATQQNAALVEETTAALGSADNQVQAVTDVISFFQNDAAPAARPANVPAPAKGAKAVQAKLTAKVGKPSVSPTKSSGGKKVAATGTDDGWEEF